MQWVHASACGITGWCMHLTGLCMHVLHALPHAITGRCMQLLQGLYCSPCSICMHRPVTSQADGCTSQAYAYLYCMLCPMTLQPDACIYCMGSIVPHAVCVCISLWHHRLMHAPHRLMHAFTACFAPWHHRPMHAVTAWALLFRFCRRYTFTSSFFVKNILKLFAIKNKLYYRSSSPASWALDSYKSWPSAWQVDKPGSCPCCE